MKYCHLRRCVTLTWCTYLGSPAVRRGCLGTPFSFAFRALLAHRKAREGVQVSPGASGSSERAATNSWAILVSARPDATQPESLGETRNFCLRWKWPGGIDGPALPPRLMVANVEPPLPRRFARGGLRLGGKLGGLGCERVSKGP